MNEPQDQLHARKDLLSIKQVDYEAVQWGATSIILNRREKVFLIWHLLVALFSSKANTRLDWAHRGKKSGWYRIAFDIEEMYKWRTGDGNDSRRH